MSAKAQLSWLAVITFIIFLGSVSLAQFVIFHPQQALKQYYQAQQNHLLLKQYQLRQNQQLLTQLHFYPDQAPDSELLQGIFISQQQLVHQWQAAQSGLTPLPQDYNNRMSQLDYHLQTTQQRANAQSMRTLSITAIALFILTITLIWYIWFMRTKHFAPLYRVINALKERSHYSHGVTKLPQAKDADIRRLTTAIESATQAQQQRLELAAVIERYNRELKALSGSTAIVKHGLAFVAKQFNSPSVSLYLQHDNHSVSVDASVGLVPTYAVVAEQLHQSVTQNHALQQIAPLWLRQDGQEIKIAARYSLPLSVGSQVKYILLVASSEVLSDNQFDTLQYLCKDLSLALAVNENMEKQQQTEAALSEQLELTNHIINAIPNPTYYRDTSGAFMGVNQAFLTLLDQFEVDVMGAKLEQVFELGTANLFAAKAQEIIDSAQAHTYEVTMLDGQQQNKELIVYEAPFFNREGDVAGVVGMFLDVSERNQLQRELIEAKDNAQESAKAKGEFLANMSHEIRTPMNAIIGMSHLALATDLNAKQHDYITKIDSAAKQLLRLINDILDFSKIEAGKVELEHEPFTLEKLMDSVATIVSIKAQEKQLELVFDIDPELPSALIGDQFRLTQVLVNLAGNAVKFTESGEVVIQVTALATEQDNAKIKFSVKDSGIGMSKQQQKSLFQSFSQADTSITRRYGGTGLGLTISQQLVKLMGGEIYVESEQGIGSEFYFTLLLPLAESTALQPANTAQFAQHQVTIVDDNQHALDVLAGMLSNFSMPVTAFTEPNEALNHAMLSEYVQSLYIVDWHMPTMDGLELISKLKQLPSHSETRFILVTAYGRELSLTAAQSALIDGVLLKPLNPSNLVDVIQSTLFDTVSARQHIHTNNHTIATDTLDGMMILVAEDQPVNQEIAVEILSSYGASVIVADNGEQALQKAAESAVDIILMDMQMPVMDGITATLKLREKYPADTLPILAMTANAMTQDIQACLAAGMNGHVAKPIDVKQLIDTIAQHSNNGLDRNNSAPLNHTHPESKTAEPEEIVDFTGIDINEGVARAAGNQHVYFDILEKFLSQQVEELINLKQALAIEDYELVRNMLHALKGASANLSIVKLTEAFKHIETTLTTSPPSAAEIDELIKYVKYTLEQCQKQRSKQRNHITSNSSNDSSQLQDLVKLACALRDYDTQASEIITTINVGPYLGEVELEQLKTAVARFEYHEALSLLTAIKPVDEAAQLSNDS
ncbi:MULTISPECIES: response regulator [unclassified Pseudoalteromonas]|uniref:response regulator n=1 Tax=unclassified Pseudoalteromonas TaxID=194690 RepID=UPI003015022F